MGDVAAGVRVGSGEVSEPRPSPYLLLRRLELAPLGAQHLGDLGKGQVRVARADLLAPLVQKAHVARDRCLGTVGQDLLPLLALGPSALLHWLQNQVAPLGGAWVGLEDWAGPTEEIGPGRPGSMAWVGVRPGVAGTLVSGVEIRGTGTSVLPRDADGWRRGRSLWTWAWLLNRRKGP